MVEFPPSVQVKFFMMAILPTVIASVHLATNQLANCMCRARRTTGRLMLSLLVPAFLFSVSVAAGAIDDPALKAVHAKTAERYAGVRHISSQELVELKERQASGLLLVDVREEAEYSVSRLPGALRVRPGVTASEFLREMAGRLENRTIVFYCSVGVRSTQLAARVQQTVGTVGAKAFYNLAGGIFNWHNQQRPLVNTSGSTDLVHPYSWRWSRLVKRKSRISYKPGGASAKGSGSFTTQK